MLMDSLLPSSWPTIASLRDKVMFVADPGMPSGGCQQLLSYAAVSLADRHRCNAGYLKDYETAFPKLSGAVMFTADDQDSSDPNGDGSLTFMHVPFALVLRGGVVLHSLCTAML